MTNGVRPRKNDEDLLIMILGLEGEIKALRGHVDDKFDASAIALSKAEQAMEARLERMNEFRDQINQERITYVKKEVLDAATEVLRAESQGYRVSVEKDFNVLDERLKKLEVVGGYDRGRNVTLGTLAALMIGALAIVFEAIKSLLGH